MDEADPTHLLRDARRYSLSVFEDLVGAQLLGQQAHHLEPPIWEMGHIAWFQEYWILRHLLARKPIHPHFDGIYDSFNVPYKKRWSHEFPSKQATLEYAQQVLDDCIGFVESAPLSRDAKYLVQLVAHHETMHTENLLGVRQTLGYPRPPGMSDVTLDAPTSGYEAHDVDIAGGTFRLGAERTAPFVLDNEQWAHDVEVAPFRIASTPVTKDQYAAFVDAGGYTDRRHWGRRGWQWRRTQAVETPFAWERRDGAWHEHVFDQIVPLRRGHPMCHVNLHEALAYCRFANRRLPTEAEWELAAAWNPATETKQTWPWGERAPEGKHANLDYERGGTIDVGLLPDGDSPTGCRQMIGNVWEWVDGLLDPYPGFEPGPYSEYSQPYLGKKPVLRGGCFATRGYVIRSTWRNFFIRHRRNIFAGFRTCAP